jgi:uncharacterized membrane protein HdeD (DUF308 family)
MARDLTRNWWAFVLQGVLAVGIGIATFVVPQPSLAAFIAVFAAFAIVTGVFEIVAGFSMNDGPKWSLVLGGVAGIAIGVLTVNSPNNTALAVTLLVGIYAVATGVSQISAAYTLGNVGNTWLLGLAGVISVAFGVYLIASPGDGVLAVLWLIGLYAIFAGILSIAFGLKLRSFQGDVSKLEAELKGLAGSARPTSTGSMGSTGSTTSTTDATAASH